MIPVTQLLFTAGNRDEQLASVNSIVVTEKLARKLFGTTDAVGKPGRTGSATTAMRTCY
jgi:hypothetical protein